MRKLAQWHPFNTHTHTHTHTQTQLYITSNGDVNTTETKKKKENKTKNVRPTSSVCFLSLSLHLFVCCILFEICWMCSSSFSKSIIHPNRHPLLSFSHPVLNQFPTFLLFYRRHLSTNGQHKFRNKKTTKIIRLISLL